VFALQLKLLELKHLVHSDEGETLKSVLTYHPFFALSFQGILSIYALSER
jgi:hypothetical protein